MLAQTDPSDLQLESADVTNTTPSAKKRKRPALDENIRSGRSHSAKRKTKNERHGGQGDGR